MLNHKFAYQRAALAAVMLLTPCLLPAAEMTVPGIKNFHQVNPKVYRGAQPSDEGFKALAKLGIRTIVDLREADSRGAAEEKVVVAAGMKYLSVPLRGLSAPAPADVAKILAVLDDESSGPVFVHCKRGADRTGTVLACYRIAHDNWENKKALSEARSLGMRWIEMAMQHFVMGYEATAAPVAAAVALSGN